MFFDPADKQEQESNRKLFQRLSSAQWSVISLLVASATASVLYRLLRGATANNLFHTSAMFVGLPVLLGVVLALTPQASSATGSIVKGITFFLLIVAPLLGEGMICILLAAPLFYLIGILIGVAVDHNRRTPDRGTRITCVALLVLPLCSEGTVPQLTISRQQTVSVRRIVAASPAQIERNLAAPPSLSAVGFLPKFLGFPVPIAATGHGLAVGDLRTTRFSGAEHSPPGDLLLRVAESHPGCVRFVAVQDTTKLAQWMRWQTSEVTWYAVNSRETAVTWRITFERKLDPAWYFNPWQRFAVRQAANFLLLANAATPAGAQ